MFVVQISLLDFRPSVSLQRTVSNHYAKHLFQISALSSPAWGPERLRPLLYTLAGGAASRCVPDPGDTVMTRSKTEPSVPGSQEAMRLTSCDNL